MCPMGAMRPLSKVGIAAVLAAVVAWPSGVAAWGMDVHRLITRRAIDGLPAELKPFYAAKADFIAEHAVDPDLWRIPDLSSKFGPEEPNHFLDYDNYGEPAPFAGVPREWNAVVQKYGADLANKNGRVPWRAEEIFDKLVTTFVDAGKNPGGYSLDNARYLSAVLAHYVEDAHQPFHGVANYDGQLTNQRGIHSRFETELVLRNQAKLKLAPVKISPVADIKTFIFDTLLAFDNYPVDHSLAHRFGAVEVRDVQLAERTHYPLTLSVVPGEQMRLRALWDPARVPGSGVQIGRAHV
mgnify:CR=1 FL=1